MGRERFSPLKDLHRGEIAHDGMPQSLPISSPPSDALGVSLDGEVTCIIHTVSKFDTLAGVAIKYGVEVADIKRLNGLVTDLQMFALKTLQIPLPGRHPPSPCFSNGSEVTQCSQQYSTRRHSDLFDTFPSLKLTSSPEQKVSSAMMNLQGYCGLHSHDSAPEDFEMAAYQNGGSLPMRMSQPRKSKSTANFQVPKKSHEALTSDSDKSIENLVRRRQKSVSDFTQQTPEKIDEEETTGGSPVVVTSKGSIPRPTKSASRTATSGVDGEAEPNPISLMDSFLNNVVNVVKRSSSASSLQDPENGTLSSIWAKTRWSLKPDFPALSTVAIARPILDGLVAKPMNRRNKAAVD